MKTVFDVLIIGGGPAGATAGILLANAGWSVGIVERTRFPRRKVCGEFLSATTVPLLRHLGVADSFFALAGPEVRRIGVFAGSSAVTAEMPRAGADAWGRALGREYLDTLLLDRALAAGACVWDSWTAVEMVRIAGAHRCRVVCKETNQSGELQARIVIAAHGSWERGPLPTQSARRTLRASDLFGFKGHLVDCDLPADLMPLLAFPGGYGGMVHTDHGRVSVSCCIRRDRLETIRRINGPAANAADAVVEYIQRTCLAVRHALAGARVEDRWMAAGPIRPGIRPCTVDGIFRVGNAAGEAHPVIAEGISMAMQSAWVLCERLTTRSMDGLSDRTLEEVRSDYAAVWRRRFAPRIRTAACVAHWAMRPWATRCSLPLLTVFPLLLTAGARRSGKATLVAPQLAARRS